MASPALDYTYRYRFASTLETASGGPRLHLATCGGADARAAEHPHFFRGQLRQPQRAADLLRCLMEIVHARFHLPGSIVRQLTDPVVTGSEGGLRFEGFSSCCSAYARVDLLPDALAGEVMGRGTTNVDFNPPLCAELARIRSGDRVGLNVGGDGVELTRNEGTLTERKVALPLRWLRGFVEVQAYSARMQRRLDVSGPQAHRFFRALPRGNVKQAWIVPAGRGLRLSQREAAGGVRVAGVVRLRTLENLARHARALRIYADPATGASGWEMDLPDCRFHLVLSPEVWRGFSGEGQALTDLADPRWQELLPHVRAALSWEAAIDSAALARKLQTPPDQVNAALSVLGARGLVGYDLAVARYFHRVLPFDLSLVESLHPRLQDARKLVTAGAIRVLSRTDDRVEAAVPGSGVEHRVHISEAGSRCSCPWFAKHQGARGPCKHVLAVQILTDDREQS
jgi:hypothetical protein